MYAYSTCMVYGHWVNWPRLLIWTNVIWPLSSWLSDTICLDRVMRFVSIIRAHSASVHVWAVCAFASISHRLYCVTQTQAWKPITAMQFISRNNVISDSNLDIVSTSCLRSAFVLRQSYTKYLSLFWLMATSFTREARIYARTQYDANAIRPYVRQR